MSLELLVSLTLYDFTSITTKHLPGLWIMTWISDSYKDRLNLILISLVFVVIGGILVTQLSAPKARYGALFIMQFGNYAAGPLQATFLANNTPTPGHRAMIQAINSMTNLIGIVAAVSFHSSS
jgi:predicted MFS family arabinose efflux permease